MEELDYNVVIVGEVSSGKSSFINSLLGTYLCPTSILRKTLVKTNNKMISHNDKTGKDEIINLIDYPGFNDAAQNTFLREFLDEISKYDHVIWITTAEKCLMNESEKKILYSICDQINLTSKLIMVSVVVNKSDMNDSNQNVFRFEKNEYEILYDNMKNNLEKDYPFVKIFKHSSYYTFLDKIKSLVFNLEPTYVDEFNRAIRTKHGPQSSNFRANDMIDYSSLLESGVLPSTNIAIPNAIEPYLFEIARSNRLESFKRALGSKRQTIGEDLELIYDVMVQISSELKFNPVRKATSINNIKATELRIAHATKSTLEKIKNRMTEMNLVAKNKNDSVEHYLATSGLDFSAVLRIVLDRQPNQVDFMNMLAFIMGEILYGLIDYDLLSKINFRNSGKSEFLHFLLYMDNVTNVQYDEEKYFGILDTIKTESKEVQMSRFEPKHNCIAHKKIFRFINAGGEFQLNIGLWNKILKLEGRFSVVKKLIDLVATNSFVLSKDKIYNYLNNTPSRLEIIQKKIIWKKYKSEILMLPRFMYKNLKFWHFNLLHVYLPNLYNPKLLEYVVEADCSKNNRDSVLPNFADFYNKST